MQPFADFDAIFDARRRETDEFYAELQEHIIDPDTKLVQRQALAGMIWNKMYYHYSVEEWLEGDPLQPPPPPERRHGRNRDWRHLYCADVISMPDKWEYPWFAAWDLAFHCIAFALIDSDFAKSQLLLLSRETYMHANGQFPAYEWAFGDVNPPVLAVAAWRVFQIDRKQRQESNPAYPGDLEFLKRAFNKLSVNFTWWVNRKTRKGTTFSRGASSASTISGYSIAAARFQPAVSSTRRMAPAGWPCTVCTSCARRSSWHCMIRRTKTSP